MSSMLQVVNMDPTVPLAWYHCRHNTQKSEEKSDKNRIKKSIFSLIVFMKCFSIYVDVFYPTIEVNAPSKFHKIINPIRQGGGQIDPHI